MIIEIHGAGFQNKGAEMMLRTTVDELRNRISDLTLAVDTYYGVYEERSKLGLWQLFPSRSHVGTPDYSKRLFQQKLFTNLKIEKFINRFVGINIKRYGCVSLSETGALIDIAGFAYSDQWGTQPTKDFAELTTYYKASKKPIILLPQAFGPFHKQETKSAFKRIIDNANLIFPRDRISYQYVKELCSDSTKVLKVPDITLFYPHIPNISVSSSSDYVCIIPNGRMLDQGYESWSEKYEPYLIKIAQEIIQLGLKVYVIVHDSSGLDLPIATSIINKLNSDNVILITESNPITIKDMIGSSRMIIGSRYHSLVASFSKAVPAIALGWSHKYEMLFEDFGCEQMIVSHDTKIDSVLELVHKLTDKDTNLHFRKQIIEKLQTMYCANQQMWDLVIKTLNI
ncbi:hypothetical protein A6770_27700 [Nostoc minutum NIES-26]|uniref:Polysaccharide pyruvyl transferase domain-containing protein n=1 Tax=Nostoc minutum NIES-26 TaxID=1844469 RepID=A0A367QP46_9NOSO|nr:hypothetical protein A6770_27700 [Nostoc minutum NIES-26]